MEPFTIREKLDGFRNGKPVTVTIRDADGNEIVATGSIDEMTLTGSATLRDGSDRVANSRLDLRVHLTAEQVVFPAERAP